MKEVTDRKREVLRTFFGYDAFRGGQEALIDSQLLGRDVFGIMPTGGGKSLCYQVPAMLLPGITVVVSPLISLMRDQVLALKSVGIPAAYINSSLSLEQLRLVYQNLRRGQYKIVYVAPERLSAEGFLAVSCEVEISLLAVDEAHCISQWGQDFRPSYLKIPEYLDKLPKRPVVSAFTATATPAVQKDIVRLLKLENPHQVVTGFDRPNLRFEVRKPQGRKGELLTLVALRKGRSGIVYCSTRKAVEEICDFLRERGISATRYHAGLSDEERAKNQEDFLYDRKTLMVATNAFGMGIDKSNVSFVIHYNMPKSLEAYYQEAGRAGRDGEKAECILLYSGQDIFTNKFLIEKSGENEELTPQERELVRSRDYERLEQMIGYCQSIGCLRNYILRYFGQEVNGRCGNCSGCLGFVAAKREKTVRETEPLPRPGKTLTRELTREAQMALSCVRRIRDKLGYDSTLTMAVRVLKGSKDKRLVEAGLDSLTTYGLMAAFPGEEIREIFAYLKERGLVDYDSREIVTVSAAAAGVLIRGEKLLITLSEEEMDARFPHCGGVEEDSGLLAALKKLRTELARKEHVPAYVIFSNSTLADMAEKAPRTTAELLEVSGVGRVKAQKYGRVFLECIKDSTISR